MIQLIRVAPPRRRVHPVARVVLPGAAVGVLCITLSLGLWPFRSPANDVHWLGDTDGLLFGRHGAVFASGRAGGALQSPAFSAELWIKPDLWAGSATLLSLYNADRRALFEVRQSLTDIEIVAETLGKRRRHVYVGDGFGPSLKQRRAAFLAVTAGRGGTAVYVDGAFAKHWPDILMPLEATAGTLIVGDSPRRPNSFVGKLFGLAIYGVDLAPADVQRHCRTWLDNHRPDVRVGDRVQGLYLFDERDGNIVHDHASNAGDLQIPATYQVLEKTRMTPFWREFEWSAGYWSGNLKNVVGFLPAGFVFCAYFRIVRRVKRPLITSVVAGLLVSLTIEVLQGFLPTRDSGTTDLITNSFGTALGAALYDYASKSVPASIRSAFLDSAQR